MDIDTHSPGYDCDCKRWHLVDSVMGGTESMRKAGKALLPQEEGESDKAYEMRLNRSTFYNRFSKAVRNASGKLMANGFHLTETVPENIAVMLEDADQEGRDLNQFLSEVCEEAMAKGVSYVLCEYPIVEGLLTREEEILAGVRPYLVHIPPQKIFYWEVRNRKLEVIRFHEEVIIDNEEICQIREITPYSWAIYRRNEKSIWTLYSEGASTLGIIPIVSFYTRRTGFMSARPPLEDLMHVNIAHWQSSSDQRHILHIARVPILFGTGLEDGIFEIGPNRLIRAEQGAELKFIEHSGKSIEAGSADIKALEEQMEQLSFSPTLQTGPGIQTATAHAIDSAEAQSTLQLVRSMWEDSANLLLSYFAKWMNIDIQQPAVTLVLPDTQKLTPSEGIGELSKARISGDISRQAYLVELVRRGILNEEFNQEEDALLIDQEAKELMINIPQGAQ